MEQRKAFNKSEDFWALLIGGILLAASLAIYLSIIPNGTEKRIESLKTTIAKESDVPFKTIAHINASEELASIKLSKEPLGRFFKKLTSKPNTWTKDISQAFSSYEFSYTLDESEVNHALLVAQAAERAARERNYADAAFNAHAEEMIGEWQAAKMRLQQLEDKKKGGSFSLGHMGLLFVLLALLFGIGVRWVGERFADFLKGFVFVFMLAFISLVLAGQKDLKALGIEYAVWAIVLGMLISNTVGTPKWIAPALKTEFYIKTGLIIMGAEVLFNKILAIGMPGMFVAWIVTPVVLISTFWFGQKILKISSKSLNITISADMSVCGVSAAVATAAASKATREELTVAIGLSMVFTAIMMVVMPLFIKFMGMPEILGGAWIGGTIDSSGAVVAAGAALGDKAMYVAATIKMIQNVLIGFVAFGVAVYFATKVDRNSGNRVGIGEIWKRFPKFILGFVGASLLFTAVYTWLGNDLAYSVIDQGILSSFSKNLRTWLFCLAFASIGLSTDFRQLSKHFSGGRPLLLYICGQTLNILLTLTMAYIMFYKVFPEVTANF